jgi:selenocysteine-specific elongation factor
MQVIATAGHVDHGKSTLVRALTGMEPDRWAEERRRGMTIDLGYAWTTLPSGIELAFVDVPGHQRFVTNMLAGVGPAAAALFVVAADEGWRRQSGEHLDALHALGIRQGLLVVTRSDLADPRPVLADAGQRLAATSLGAVEGLAVSGRTGTGLDELRQALDRLVARLGAPDPGGRIRLWIDRSFSVRGSGTVVTGTLGAGSIAVGDELQLRDQRVRVRGLQQLGRPADRVHGVARVAVNLRSIDTAQVRRGDALLTRDAWHWTAVVDARLEPILFDPPAELTVHVGSASVPARVRMLSADLARLTLRTRLPLQFGDRLILRDPAQQCIVAGALVLDADPPDFDRRGAAQLRAAELDALDPADAVDPGGIATQVRRRQAVRRQTLVALGLPVAEPAGVLVRQDWLIDQPTWLRWQRELTHTVDEYAAAHPQQPGLPLEKARQRIGVPDPALLRLLTRESGLELAAGRVARPGVEVSLGAAEGAVQELEARLSKHCFDAPERTQLEGYGLTSRDLATAERAGRLLRLAPDIVVGPNAAELAAAVLAGLPQPFTTSQARQALDTTRRIAVPLLEHLDRLGLTARIDASTRAIVSVPQR